MNDFMQLQERENQRSPYIPGQAALDSNRTKASGNQTTSNVVNKSISEHGKSTQNTTSEEFAISKSVKRTVGGYLDAMQGQDVEGLYELVLSEIEAPLLESVMKAAGDNQSLTAKMLGLNRGTLRKKLKKYGML